MREQKVNIGTRGRITWNKWEIVGKETVRVNTEQAEDESQSVGMKPVS